MAGAYAASAAVAARSHEQRGLHDEAAHHVRVQVGRGAAVLVVAALLRGHHAADADGAAAVGDAPREVVDGGCLVLAGQAALVALAVRGNVHGVALAQLLALLLDGGPADAGGAGGLGGEVRVAAGAVPVARDGLGVKGALHLEHLAHTVHDVARHPQVVAHADALAGAHLVLPLRGQHLAVHAADVDASEQAAAVVHLGDVAADGHAGAGGAVVGALGCGVAALGPAQRPLGGSVEQRVLLLNAKPGLLGLGLLHHLGAGGARVGGDGLQGRHGAIGQHAGGLVRVAHDEDVVTATEGILEDGAGNQVHLGVVAGGLAGGGAVIVPHRQVLWLGRQLVQRPGLGAQVLA
mmetsp:Transcript_21456/g.54623  ORF Transcript_21456/g.54623 Transcript_21456/m.54623 type:complete len:350 (-) Transcript_21456:230-1279(-)